MNRSLLDFAAAVLFGLGLALSGMTMPEKVIGFLDVFGDWDPALMFVMIGAIAVHAVAYVLITRSGRSPLYSSKFHLPVRSAIDKPLLIGSAIFGFGWGLAGFCPGPALVAVITGESTVLVFVGSMIAGIFLYRLVNTFVKKEGHR